MRRRIRMLALVGLATIGAFAVLPEPAHAGCGGGGGSWGTRTYGRAPAYSGGGCGSGCAMMNMGGMNMGGMVMPATSMPGMNMGAMPQAPAAPAAPAAAAGHYYTCPMHPNVASAAPGSCPYCHMALSYR